MMDHPRADFSSCRGPRDIVEVARAHPMTRHRYFARMADEPPNLTALWAYYNGLVAVTHRVPDWLARILVHTDDVAVKCFLAAILNDELGDGDPDSVHALLLDRQLAVLAPWAARPRDYDPATPGQRMCDAMAKFFAGDAIDVDFIIGSLMSGEIHAENMIGAIGEQVRRQDEVPVNAFRWQLTHEKVEGQHADISRAFTGVVPTAGDAFASVRAGAQWKHDTFLDWLDGLYRVTYG